MKRTIADATDCNDNRNFNCFPKFYYIMYIIFNFIKHFQLLIYRSSSCFLEECTLYLFVLKKLSVRLKSTILVFYFNKKSIISYDYQNYIVIF